MVVPTPTRPLKLALANCEVEEAWRPAVNHTGVEVEFAVAEKFEVEVKGKAEVRPAPVT